MGLADMSNNRTKDLFPSPALSLSLAGIFRNAAGTGAAAGNDEVEEGDEGSCGGGGGGSSRREETTVEISSENSGPASRSFDELDGGGDGGSDDDDDGGHGDKNKKKKKKRKKYHRHTSEQIREMEALFKESPHPDEKQREQLSKQLGLAPRQVKFWFQNRRTQMKGIQERHENSILKSELEKLREENKVMRETIAKSCCPNCGVATTSRDISLTSADQQLRMENAKLKHEVEKLRAAAGKSPTGAASASSCSAGNDDHQDTRISFLGFSTGISELEKSRIMELASQGMEELKKMATAGEPLWVRSVETGREILNYDEYVKEFSVENSLPATKRSIEASRDTGVVFVDLPKLVQSFMDVNQWKAMFPCLISKAATVDVICSGEGPNRDGGVQLMFSELQMLTPMVPTREVYFVRYCKQLSPEQWAVIDVSIDKIEENIDASLAKCRKLPSGCIIEDQSNGHCKVIWVEHLECGQKATVHAMYRSIVNSGLAFGARHWMATLQLQCERHVFFMATNVPTKDSSGVSTPAGRKSILKLAQRMTWSFFRAISASSYHTWSKVTGKTGEDLRVSSRKNLNDPGEPLGAILCAVSSVWLPVSPHALFDFIRDLSRRREWDFMSNGGPVQSIAHLANGQARGNAVTIQTMRSKEKSMWVLQDSCTNAYESMVVYAPVDIPGMQTVITGCDSGSIAILPSGFSILPDGVESRPLVITSRRNEKGGSEGGALLTVAFQILINSSPAATPTMESLDSVDTLISCTFRNIKRSLQCEDA